MANLIGHTINERYKLEALLGDGGMGTVYRAYDLNLDRQMAIKLMHSHFARRSEFRARLIQEAKTAAQLDHPSVVGIYDFGELYDKMRDGVENYLSREETETSLSQAVYRWSTRKKTSEKIGKPIFALAKYEKIYRITIPIGGAGLILISTDLDVDVNGIVDKILKIKENYN